MMNPWQPASPFPHDNQPVRGPGDRGDDFTWMQGVGGLWGQSILSEPLLLMFSLPLLLPNYSFGSITLSKCSIDEHDSEWHSELSTMAPKLPLPHSQSPTSFQDWPPSLTGLQFPASPPITFYIFSNNTQMSPVLGSLP